MGAFDFEAFRSAFERRDVDAWLRFYADDAEWIELKPTAPPRAPHRLVGREAIRTFLTSVSRAHLTLEVRDEVVGEERAAFAVTVTFPDGSRVVEHVIVHLADGRIVRQVDVEAWD